MQFRSGLILIAAGLALTPLEAAHLTFSTYVGGDRQDIATSAVVDAEGNTIFAGETDSKNFPAKSVTAVQPNASTNGFATKLNASDEVVWSVSFGGDATTRPGAVAVDLDGNIYITGQTGAKNFPTLNPVQSQQTGVNIGFLMKLDKTGKLLFSTFIGGDRNDEPNAIALDSKGNIYIAGRASSTKFPVKDGLQMKIGGGNNDGFIAKFTPDYQLAYATYLGGTGAEDIAGLAIGPDDSVYVVGETYSPNMGTEGAWIAKTAGYHGFAARITPSGDAISYFTYIAGRNGYTRANAVAVDQNGSAYITGYTSAKDFPTTERAVQPKYAGGSRDAFLLKLNPSGSAPEYLTYLGGSYTGQSDPDELGRAIKLDSHGHVYILGETTSIDFPTVRPLQAALNGPRDAFVTRLDIENGRILFSTFWGGGKQDLSFGLTLGPGENATITGQTWSDDFKLERPLLKTMASTNDAFVSRFCDPWLGANPGAVRFAWTLGQPAPEAQDVQVFSGCKVKHEITEAVSSASWLSVTPDRASMPAKVKFSVKTEDLTPGEHEGTITVTVPDAFNSPLRIPVVISVSEPPVE